MTSFEILASSTGHSFGVYTAATSAAAIQAMIADAGHDGPADSDVVAKEVVLVGGKAYKLANLAHYMDDAVRESIHGTTDTDGEFWAAYVAAVGESAAYEVAALCPGADVG